MEAFYGCILHLNTKMNKALAPIRIIYENVFVPVARNIFAGELRKLLYTIILQHQTLKKNLSV